jgi:hypothetical protein
MPIRWMHRPLQNVSPERPLARSRMICTAPGDFARQKKVRRNCRDRTPLPETRWHVRSLMLFGRPLPRANGDRDPETRQTQSSRCRQRLLVSYFQDNSESRYRTATTGSRLFFRRHQFVEKGHRVVMLHPAARTNVHAPAMFTGMRPSLFFTSIFAP